jgi:hypothetical protein
MPIETRNRRTPVSEPVRRASVAACGLAVALSLGGCTLFEIPSLFRLNHERQEEGYWMGEFEYQMLGLAYRLDHGEYGSALRGLEALHDRLETREGLVRVPAFADEREELEFFLGLQDPTTGAFMDPSYPYPMYEGPTGNMLEHLESLARRTGQPLRLKYPLRFFDEIAAPEKLRAFLDDVGTVGWIGARFPQTSFHVARNHLAYADDESILDRNQLYTFSPEWKRTLLQWFADHQDPKTGFWGPLARGSGQLRWLDLNNTSTILRHFVDAEGHDLRPDLPLRHRGELVATMLDELSKPMPAPDDLDELHEWVLAENKGLRTLLRYLWQDLTPAQRARASGLLEAYLRVAFDRYFVAAEGAFGYYPDVDRATLDGTGMMIGLLHDLGAFSRATQDRLWGGPTGQAPGIELARPLLAEDLRPLRECEGVRSIRVYDPKPDRENLARNVAWVVYPEATGEFDAADLLPRLQGWLAATPQRMGNWTSRETVLARPELDGVVIPQVATHDVPLAGVEAILARQGVVTAIGFDVLQRPRCERTFARPPKPGLLVSDRPNAP